MLENVYECMFLLDANAYARNSAGAADGIQKMVDQFGGKMLASRLWNEQKLAYPIRGRHKGAYWLSYFRMNTEKLVEFNRACQLNDIVLRHLVIKVDDRLVDALVSAAKGEIKREDPPEETLPVSSSVVPEEPTEPVAAVDG